MMYLRVLFLQVAMIISSGTSSAVEAQAPQITQKQARMICKKEISQKPGAPLNRKDLKTCILKKMGLESETEPAQKTD